MTNLMEEKLGVVDSGFVETCGELVIESNFQCLLRIRCTMGTNQGLCAASTSYGF